METYLGIYIQAEKKEIEVKCKESICPNGHFVNHFIEANYCSTCGSKVKIINKPSKEYANFYDIITDELVDTMLHVDIDTEFVDILLPNYDIRYGKILEDCGEYNIVQKSTLAFEKEYKDFLDYIRPHYKEVNVKYGVIVYYD